MSYAEVMDKPSELFLLVMVPKHPLRNLRRSGHDGDVSPMQQWEFKLLIVKP